MGNLNLSLERYLALRRSIIEDGISLSIPFSDKDLRTIQQRTVNEGSSFVLVTLPMLGKALDLGLISGYFICPKNFACRRNSSLPQLTHDVFRLVFKADGQLKEKPNIVAIRYLRLFLLFDSKVHMQPSIKQEEDAIAGFEHRMEDLMNFRIDSNNRVLSWAKELMTETLSTLDLSEIRPGHGPGGVADGKDRLQRWDFDSWPLRANYTYPFYRFAVSSLEALQERSNFVLVEKPCTKICLVPKDFKGPRLISAESTATQYLQQGQMRKMMHFIKYHPLLRLSMRLDDQTFNQIRAKESVQNRQATVDLSNASDTVSVQLVWYLLSGVPKLRKYLFSTRSYYSQHKNKKIRLVAFAPMGSAVCFPVETLVFWALSMASVRLHRCEHHPIKGVILPTWRNVAPEVTVFGDDIIIPTDGCLETLLTTLQSVGCSPNMSKTCWKTPFRESCGKDYFNGIDVSIIRNRSFHYGATNKLSDYPVLLDLQRKFFAIGLFRTARLLAGWAREIYPIIEYSISPRDLEAFRQNLEAFRADTEGDNVVFHRYQDQYCFAFSDRDLIDPGIRTRFNSAYQRIEARLPRLIQRSLEWKSDGYPRLLARLLSDRIDRIPNRDVIVKIGWSSIPAYAGICSPKFA